MTATFSKGIRVAESAWPLVAERLAVGAVGLLPIGAASKAHGRHLPMNTDWVQIDWLVEALVQRRNVVAWPTVGYGYYPAFSEYPGSVSLTEMTFVALVGDILNEMQRAGGQRVLVINTGISTISPLEAVIETAQGFHSLQLVNVYDGPNFLATQNAIMEQSRGGHADEIETSIMLAIAPDRVDLALAETCVERRISGRFNRTDPQAANYSPSGVYGDPTLATAEKGQRLLSAMLADVLAVIDA